MKLKKHRYKISDVIRALELREEGLTYRAISLSLKKDGVRVSHKSVYEWTKKFDLSSLRQTQDNGKRA